MKRALPGPSTKRSLVLAASDWEEDRALACTLNARHQGCRGRERIVGCSSPRYKPRPVQEVGVLAPEPRILTVKLRPCIKFLVEAISPRQRIITALIAKGEPL